MDLVRLYRVYQVHLPCLRSPFGAYPVDLVQAFKVDLVHPAFLPDFPSRRLREKEKQLPGAERGRSALGRMTKQLPRAERGRNAPGRMKKQLPRAERGRSAPGGMKKLLPRAERGRSDLGGMKKQLPWAERGRSALGRMKKQLPRAERGRSAPGGQEKRLPGAERTPSAPGRMKKQLPRAERGRSALGGVGFHRRVDQVGFQGVYQVHLVWLRGASGAGAVDLVQVFKVDLVHHSVQNEKAAGQIRKGVYGRRGFGGYAPVCKVRLWSMQAGYSSG